MEEFNDWNNPKNIKLSPERQKQFWDIVNKHLDAMSIELKATKICPSAYGLRWASVHELDELIKLSQQEE